MTNGQVPKELVLKGYMYSRYGAVAFILNDITPDTLNNILDPIVPGLGLNIPGVKYVKMDVRPDVFDAISSAKLIVTLSPLFSEMVSYCAKIQCRILHKGHPSRVLERISAEGDRHLLVLCAGA